MTTPNRVTAFEVVTYFDDDTQMSTPINELPEESVQNVEDDDMIHDIMAELNSEANPVADQGNDEYERQQAPQYYNTEYVEQRPITDTYKKPPRSLVKTIWRETKWPLLVLALFVVFSLQIVDKSLLRLIPKLARESGNLGVFGLLLKGLVLSIVFFILTKLI